MMSITKTTSFALLLAATFVVGCGPKKSASTSMTEEQLAMDPAANFTLGMEALQPDRKGVVDYESAYTFFNKAAEELNGGPKAHFNAGWVAEQLGDSTNAIGHYKAAFEADPSYQAAMYSLTRLYTQNGQAQQAADVLAVYLSTHEDDTQARTDYMAALVAAGQHEQAITEGQKILLKDPKNDAVYRILSSLYYDKGMLEMADLTSELALESNDADPNVYNNMGVVALSRGDNSLAIEKFEQARKLLSTHFEANMNLGVLALDSGDYALALDCFQKATEAKPTDIDAKLGLAIALRGTGDFAGAASIYDGIIKTNPENEDAYFNAAILNERYKKDFTKALKYLEAYKDSRAGSLSPDDPVFAQIDAVAAAKAAEDERKRLEAERKRLEAERRKRALELLGELETQVVATQSRLEENMGCLPEDTTMEVAMVLESMAESIEAEDADTATDLQQMLNDFYMPMLEDSIATNCGGAPAEGAPAEGAEGTEEGAPADGADSGDSAMEETAEAADAPTEE